VFLFEHSSTEVFIDHFAILIMGGDRDEALNDRGNFNHYNTVAPKETKVFSLFDNRGKTAIVTGAGAGIGLAVAECLAESGANVAIWYHGNKTALTRAREIEEEYGVICIPPTDNGACKRLLRTSRQGVSNRCPKSRFVHEGFMIRGSGSVMIFRLSFLSLFVIEQVEELVDSNVKELNGRLDIFVANAGIPWVQGSFLDGEVDHYRNVMSTDMDSTYYCARAAGQHWRRQKETGQDVYGKKLEKFRYGSFIATASMSGHIVNIPQYQAAYNAAKAGVIHFGRIRC